MINRSTFNDVKARYGHYASWAIWSEEGEKPKDGVGDISFFEDPSDDLLRSLNPNVVLVGLNISGAIGTPLGNFHSSKSAAQDYKLRHAMQGTEFWGGYITDVIKDFEEKISTKVTKHLKDNPLVEEQNINVLQEELDAIGSSNPLLIALGGECYSILNKNLAGIYQVLKAPHYAMYISKENYRAKFDLLRNRQTME